MTISALAGKLPPTSALVDVVKLVTAYYANVPDPSVPGQGVAFGTSGHRGTSFDKSFNERHVLAISRAIAPHGDPAASRNPADIQDQVIIDP